MNALMQILAYRENGGWSFDDATVGLAAEPDGDGIPSLTLGDGGKGVNRKLEWLKAWFSELSERMDGVRVCCGDWARIMSPGTMKRNGPAAVLLDPPYSLTDAVYAHDSSTVSSDVQAWCRLNGADPLLRIALCGHDTEHNELTDFGWIVETWAKGGGYQGADDRERIWFSPGCAKIEETQLSLL